MLAAASSAIVVGFNVRPNAEAKQLADREGVDIRTYRVIYQLTEDIQRALIGMLSPERVEEVLGEVEVRQTFRASRVGTIAGCMVTQGTVQRGAQVRIVRDGTIVHDGRIGTLKRFQDDVREVAQGFECGITIDNFNDIKEGDVLEVYTVREVARSA
jgi:translation initiation factor IF-2